MRCPNSNAFGERDVGASKSHHTNSSPTPFKGVIDEGLDSRIAGEIRETMRQKSLRHIANGSKSLGAAEGHLRMKQLRMIGLHLAATAYLRHALSSNLGHESIHVFLVGKANGRRVSVLR